MLKKSLIMVVLLFSLLQLDDQKKHVFSFDKTNFLLDGKPFQIISGEMHPARIPEPYWRQRIKMAKAMGCKLRPHSSKYEQVL